MSSLLDVCQQIPYTNPTNIQLLPNLNCEPHFIKVDNSVKPVSSISLNNDVKISNKNENNTELEKPEGEISQHCDSGRKKYTCSSNLPTKNNGQNLIKENMMIQLKY